MSISRQTIQQSFAEVGSSPAGLSLAEAAQRLRSRGANQIHVARREPPLVLLLREFSHFLR